MRARFLEAVVMMLPCAILSALLLPVGLAGPTDSISAALVKSGHWKRARPLIEQQYQANPNSAELAWLLSKVDLAYGDLEQALSLAEKAVAIDDKNSNYRYQLAEVCGRTAEKASLFSKGHWAKRFKAEAETAAGLDPNNLDARFGLLEYYLQAPRLMGGGKEKAGAMAEEIGRIDSVSGDLAQARIAQDQKDPAKEHIFFTNAAEGSPRAYDDLISIASYFSRTAATTEGSPARADGRPPADLSMAEKLAHQSAKLEPGREDAYAVLAGLYSAQKRWKDLDAVLAESEKHVPDNLAPYYRAAHVLLGQSSDGNKDLTRGEIYLRKYLSQNPEPDSPSLAEAHWQLGLVLEKEGRNKEAASEVEAALSMNPNLARAKIDLKRIQSGI
jgi:tetratricopeptide (TPR) repeat protein